MLFFHNIVNSVWNIEPGFAANYLPLVTEYLQGKRNAHALTTAQINERTGVKLNSNAAYSTPEEAPENSVAIINISGAITKHDQDCGPAGMQTKSNLLKACFANTNIKAVALVIDSGGGEGRAMRMMAESIGTRNKPVAAFIDDFACSAAYGIASACDIVIANSALAEIGSIGTYITIADFTEQLKQQGIKLTEIYATASKDKNNEFREAVNGNPEPVRAICDQFNNYFLDLIETNRGDKLTADRKTWGTGKVFFAKEALALGLIDGVDTFDNFLNYFNN